MTKAGGGSIINVSSLAGLLGVGNVHAYTAAKGGVISLTRAVATAYAAKNIRCKRHVPRCGGHADDGPRAARLESQTHGTGGQEPSTRPGGHPARHRLDGPVSGLGRIVVGDGLGILRLTAAMPRAVTSGAARPSADIDPEQPVLDLDRIGPQPHGRIGSGWHARRRCKAKAVPRTGHGSPL